MPEKNHKNLGPGPAPKVINRGNILLLCAAICIFTAFSIWLFKGTIRVVLNSYGMLHSGYESYDLYADEMDGGYVSEIYVEELDYVHEGDLLCRIYEKAPTGENNGKEEKYVDITSPWSGFVTEILTRKRSEVVSSNPIMRIMLSEYEQIDGAVAFLDGEAITELNRGARVKISVKDVEGGKTLRLDGCVEYISTRPISRNILTYVVGKDEAEVFYEEGVDQYLVKVMFDEDELEKASRLYYGQICKISFITVEKHPYQVFFGE
ncbi:MAG: hypothetical protein Q4B67_07820 [Eubacteriales bacterium]|nr:hypothetical protein [Eubacteriales bacterium]